MLHTHMGTLDLHWQRGDVNFDGRVNVADAINLVICLFSASRGVYCRCIWSRDEVAWEVFNTNEDQRVNIADAIYILGFLFRDGPPIGSLP